MSCRLPGADGVDALWDLLMAEGDAITTIPPERFDDIRYGGVLDGVADFDAEFFDMTDRDAVRLDPQQRLVLETTWEAIEDAGIPTESLAGTNTGVYATCLTKDYWDLLRDAGLRDELRAAVGAHTWGVPAGRISRALDLRGPSFGMEATCATSLLGIHLACQSLRSGESDLAVVAAANVLLTSDIHLGFAGAGALAEDGRCKFTSADADGYVRSDGAAAIVLKPLSAAVADGDRIHLLILGSSVTHNGNTGRTLIAPSPDGQEHMLRTAHRAAGIEPSDVDYIEAHGTGTPKGDAAELTALSRVFGAGRDERNPLLLGSIKTNIGHPEFAAGLAGLIKTALCLRHGIVPASLHSEPASELMASLEPGIELVRSARQWPERDRPRLAGISAFGLSGANSHVVVSEPPRVERQSTGSDVEDVLLLPISARTEPALRELAGAYVDLLTSAVDAEHVRDICFSAGARRSTYEYRTIAVGTHRELIEQLRRPRIELAEPVRRLGFGLSGDDGVLKVYRDWGLEPDVVAGPGEPRSSEETLWLEFAAEPQDLRELLTALATAWTHGHAPRWERVYPGARFTPLPHYPWQRRRYWVGDPSIG